MGAFSITAIKILPNILISIKSDLIYGKAALQKKFTTFFLELFLVQINSINKLL